MITNNFKKLLAAINTCNSTGGTAIFPFTLNNVYSLAAQTYVNAEALGYPQALNLVFTAVDTGITVGDPLSIMQSSRLIIGTGDTAATADDYQLVSALTSNLSHVGGVVTKSFTGDKVRYSIARTFTYTGQSDVTIKEVGVYQNIYTAVTPLGGYQVLILRDVLANPFVIHTGDTFTVPVGIEF